VTGAADVPQQVPRAESAAPPSEATVAPKTAVASVTDEDVGVFTVGGPETVMVVAIDDTALYAESAALVAVTVQVPGEVNESVDPATEQPAVPADVTA
jgi:hypothetical protein